MIGLRDDAEFRKWKYSKRVVLKQSNFHSSSHVHQNISQNGQSMTTDNPFQFGLEMLKSV